MKKHLIAAAVAGALAVPAMAQVTVYGVIDQGYTSTEEKISAVGLGVTADAYTKDVSTTGNGSAYTSQRLGFKGEEDLGGGMKASFVYELGLEDRDGTDSGSDITGDKARQLNVGISGGFGSFKVGRMGTQADSAWGVGDVGGGNNFIGRAYTSGLKLNNSRSDRLIEYTSPAMSGFSVAVQYGQKETDTQVIGANTQTASHDEMGLGLRYSAGPLNVMLGYSQEETKAANVKTSEPEQIVLGMNYDLGMAKVFFTYADGEDSRGAFPRYALLKDLDAAWYEANITASKLDHEVMEIGASIPLGAFTVNVSYFQADTNSRDLEDPTDKTKFDTEGFQIAGLYALSKRTMVYVAYGEDEMSAKVPGEPGISLKDSREQMGFGIRHSF